MEIEISPSDRAICKSCGNNILLGQKRVVSFSGFGGKKYRHLECVLKNKRLSNLLKKSLEEEIDREKRGVVQTKWDEIKKSDLNKL